jgi:hypothetical protein
MENKTGFSESFLLGTFAALGGLITVIFAAIRKSRCTTLNCCGMRCTREPLTEEAVLNEIKIEKQPNVENAENII